LEPEELANRFDLTAKDAKSAKEMPEELNHDTVRCG